MGIIGGFASYGYSYKSFSFTAKINGIRKHFLAGCGIKQLKGLVEGLYHPLAHQVLVSARGKIPNLMYSEPRGLLMVGIIFYSLFPNS